MGMWCAGPRQAPSCPRQVPHRPRKVAWAHGFIGVIGHTKKTLCKEVDVGNGAGVWDGAPSRVTCGV
eukprot:361505-Chlamydomonas_euryale.AAC.7